MARGHPKKVAPIIIEDGTEIIITRKAPISSECKECGMPRISGCSTHKKSCSLLPEKYK